MRNSVPCEKFITDNVESASTVITDGWRGYLHFNELVYEHCVINHSVGYVDNEDRTIYTNGIERVWRSLKNELRCYTRIASIREKVKSLSHSTILASKPPLKKTI